MKTISKQAVQQNLFRIIEFLKFDIWRMRLDEFPFGKSFLIRQLRIVILTLRGFDEDKCRLRASALTFYTLLSIVPVLAMLFGVAKGFGFEKILERELYENFPGQEEILNQIVGFSRSMLEATQGGGHCRGRFDSAFLVGHQSSRQHRKFVEQHLGDQGRPQLGSEIQRLFGHHADQPPDHSGGRQSDRVHQLRACPDHQ